MVASISPTQLKSRLDSLEAPVVVDVRRQPAYLASSHILPGSIRRLPGDVSEWAEDLDRYRTIVVYCVHGHEVSQRVAAALETAGYDVAYLDGGIAGWAAAGLPLRAKLEGGSR